MGHSRRLSRVLTLSRKQRWGANLGTSSEALVSGRVADVLPAIEAARARAKEAAGWVMDLALLRAPEASA